jgi:glucosamine--fructose-6-phosphate aminotransferase (isomerizing)
LDQKAFVIDFDGLLMCSIIGYYGNDLAAPIMVRGLSKMEYRGYDSVGVATKSGDSILVKKGVGRVAQVNESESLDSLPGKIGIGHTRWATHGIVNSQNAHPHYSNSAKIALVHNGTLENDDELREFLINEGFEFLSETDTEVIVNLLEYNFTKSHNPLQSVCDTVSRLKGNFSFVALFDDDTMIAARFHEPLIIGVGNDSSYYVSSDVLGFVDKTDQAIYPDNQNIVLVDGTGLSIYDFDAKKVSFEIVTISKEFGDVYKGDYAHFTLKEISEQPDTILTAGESSKTAIIQCAGILSNSQSICMIGSGSSYNAALLAKHLFLKYSGLRIEAIIASEISSSPELIPENSTVLAISQSGESADVLESVRIAKKKNCKIISIVNTMNCSLALESSVVIGLNCGPEIGVAATKSFTSQIVVFLKILSEISKTIFSFEEISNGILELLSDKAIPQISEEISQSSDIYVLGRGIHYPISLESALKLKELTYIHAEGIAGGELKHGPLALMDESTFVIVLNPDDSTYVDTFTSSKEIKSRGAKIIGISDKNNDVYDYWIKISSSDGIQSIFFETVAVQLLSYFAALQKDVNPDFPRNLAKSVTVK